MKKLQDQIEELILQSFNREVKATGRTWIDKPARAFAKRMMTPTEDDLIHYVMMNLIFPKSRRSMGWAARRTWVGREVRWAIVRLLKQGLIVKNDGCNTYKKIVSYRKTGLLDQIAGALDSRRKRRKKRKP